MDINSLDRFVSAQEYYYETALAEIRGGRKYTHWMWFIFPQLRGLGYSEKAYAYGIADLNEAHRFTEHPLLSHRLIEITEALLALEQNNAFYIFGRTDERKLRSCMTLFSLVSPDGSVFHRALDKFFGGIPDPATLEMVGRG